MANRFIIEIRTKGFKGAERDLDNVKKKTDTYKKSNDQLRGSTAGLRRDIGKMRNDLLLASFAFGSLVVAVDKVVEAYRKQLEAETKLRASLKNVRTATKQGADQLINLAAGYEKITTFGDEVTLSGMAMLATFQLNERQIAQLTPRMLDMAAATGKDMVSSAMLLGKAFTGQASALTEAGVLIDKTTLAAKEAEGPIAVFNFLLGEMDKNFRGVAVAIADTDIGKIDQMANSIGTVNEQMGKMAVPLKLATSELQLFGTKMASFIALLVQQGASGLPGTGTGRWGGLINQALGLKEALKLWKELNREIQTSTTLGFGPQLPGDEHSAIFGAPPRPDAVPLPLDPDAPPTIEEVNDAAKTFNQTMEELGQQLVDDLPTYERWTLDVEKSTDVYRDAATGLLSVANAIKTVGDSSASESRKFGAFVQLVGSIMTISGMPSGALVTAAGSLFGHTGGLITDNGIQRFAHGGVVQGQDNVPIMAQAGEFIMKREAVQNIGIDQLARMNRTGSAGITVNITGGIVQDDYIRNELIPALNKATSLGSRINA